MVRVVLLFLSVLTQCSLITAWSFLHLVVQHDLSAAPIVSVIPNAKIEPSKSSNASYSSIKPDFCTKNKVVFNSTDLMDNCKAELVPFISHLESSAHYSDLPIFIVFHNESKDMIRDHTGFVFQGIAGVMFMYSDPLSVRKALLLDIQIKIPVHSVELVRIIAPELELDLNLELYHGSLFVSELERVIADDAAFSRFKAFNPVVHVTHPLNIWMVYFSLWYRDDVVTELVSNLAALVATHPSLYAQIKPVSLIDTGIGSPETIDIQLTAVDQKPVNVTVSPIQIRFFLESALLEDTFGIDGLTDKHILEIGGGYGGMAVTMQSLYTVGKYSIVDLPAAGGLQSKYVHATGKSTIKIAPISSLEGMAVESDLLISFFAISELRRDTVDRYLQQYVRHAKNGLLQLNAYEFEEQVNETRVMVDGTHLYSMLDLFRAVYQVHPHAVLLPPPSYHQYHRIMWKDPRPQPQPKAKTEAEMIQWCEAWTGSLSSASVNATAVEGGGPGSLSSASVNTTAVEGGGPKETTISTKPISYSVKKQAPAAPGAAKQAEQTKATQAAAAKQAEQTKATQAAAAKQAEQTKATQAAAAKQAEQTKATQAAAAKRAKGAKK